MVAQGALRPYKPAYLPLALKIRWYSAGSALYLTHSLVTETPVLVRRKAVIKRRRHSDLGMT